VTSDPAAWIDEESYLLGFKWADPSKIWINDVFKLFDHWRQQKQSRLAPIIRNTSCEILTNTEKPVPWIQNWGTIHANQNPCPRSASSESEDFGPAMAAISEAHFEPPHSSSPPPSPAFSQRVPSAPGPMTSEEVFPD
jgi:hypothetical protein